MECERRMLEVAKGDVELLRSLVAGELDRRMTAIDDIVVAGYGSFIGKRAETNRDAVKVAVMELVRSPLADMERKLGAESVKVEEKPVAVRV